MEYCRHCGQQVYPDAVVCVHCGRDLRGVSYVQDTGNIGWGVLGFFFPIIGLILYLIWKDERPKTARIAGKGALVNLIVGAVFLVVYIIIVVAFIGSAVAYQLPMLPMVKALLLR